MAMTKTERETRANARKLLRGAKVILKNPKHWTKETLARDDAGFSVDTASGSSFCLLGALYNVADFDETLKSHHIACAEQALEEAVTGGFVGAWNDAPERKHRDVLKAIDKGIKHLGGKV